MGARLDRFGFARRGGVELGGGATDSRAIYGLEQKLANTDFDPQYISTDYDGLQNITLPAMVTVDWGFALLHMVTVMEIDADRVLLGDPLSGLRKVSRKAFEEDWHGRAIYLQRKK